MGDARLQRFGKRTNEGRGFGALDHRLGACDLFGRSDLLPLVGKDLVEYLSHGSDLSMAQLDQSIENSLGLAAVDGLGGQGNRLAQRIRFTDNEQRRRGIEENDVAERPLISLQHRADMGGVLDRIAAGQIFGPRLRETGVPRRDLEGRDPATVEHRHMTDARGGELVEPIGAMHDPGALDPEQTKHAGNWLDPLLGEYTDHLIFGVGRIGERTEQIEDGANAELAPYFRDVAYGGMVDRGEHEAEPALF